MVYRRLAVNGNNHSLIAAKDGDAGGEGLRGKAEP
jgi:hypothetical protein